MNNRLLKFRTWVIEAKRFIKVDSYCLGENGSIYPFGISPQSVVTQQFTGLKDRDGNEIYEGDILELSEKDKLDYYEPYCHVWYSDSGTYVVSFNHMYSETSCDLYMVNYTYKIVGNILENEELIK